ncbi:acetyltransferase [Tateyamaria omphalii]|uniref:GNAT family N-acetyltransferase n=1 Tax=Tateyamaria omphalii TaxID=299262 RepID=UPI00167ACAA9|nr:GNAT family N-acetyltransferase [Tateyamaria omphalii]GGX58426.1 acetyltransferase [Tateyamaria omphalii]
MIETDRLILRKPIADDFEPLADMFGEPRVTEHIGGTLTRTDAWARLLRDVGHWALEGFGQFIIADKATGSFVGKVGFAKYKRDLGPHADTEIECSWTLRSSCHGKGYAREAAEAAHTWYNAHQAGPTACMIGEANAASLRLAASLGYAEIDRLAGASGVSIVLQRDGSRRDSQAGIKPQP